MAAGEPPELPRPPDRANGDDALTWIGGDAPQRLPPEGRAPRLVPPHVTPRRPAEPSPFVAIRPALLVPAFAALVALLLFLLDQTSAASLERTRRLACAVAERPLEESLARIARQRALGSTLLALRAAQRQIVNARCESGAWCDERVAARDRSLRLAEAFLAAGRAWPVSDAELPPARAGALLPLDLETLYRERALLSQGRVASPEHLPTGGPAELAARLALVEAEIRLVEEAQP